MTSKMATSDTDPGEDPVVEVDLADLEFAECDSCLGTRVVRDAATGERGACRSCASASSTSSASPASPAELAESAIGAFSPEWVRAVVAGERRRPSAMSSPVVALADWALDYMDAERAFRRAQAGVLSGDVDCSVYEASVARVASAELALRRAVSPVSDDASSGDAFGAPGDLERSDLIEIVANLPGVEASLRPDLAEVAALARARRPAASSPPRLTGSTGRRMSRMAAGIRSALERLRGPWEPR